MKQWLCGVFTNHHPVDVVTREVFGHRCSRCGRQFGNTFTNDPAKSFAYGYRAGRTCSYPVPMDTELNIPRWQVEEVARQVLASQTPNPQTGESR